MKSTLSVLAASLFPTLMLSALAPGMLHAAPVESSGVRDSSAMVIQLAQAEKPADPFVERRKSNVESKKELKAKKISKEDYKKQKKDRTKALKSAGVRGEAEKNIEGSAPSK